MSSNYSSCVNCGKPVITVGNKIPYCDKCQRVASRPMAGFDSLSEEEQDRLLGMDGETETALWNEFKYVATDEKPQTGWNYSWIKRPSIHMPKEAARIWLKVTAVRAERLQDITEEQARAEGCIDFHDKIGNGKFDDVLEFDLTARDAFVDLWNSTLKKILIARGRITRGFGCMNLRGARSRREYAYEK